MLPQGTAFSLQSLCQVQPTATEGYWLAAVTGVTTQHPHLGWTILGADQIRGRLHPEGVWEESDPGKM